MTDKLAPARDCFPETSLNAWFEGIGKSRDTGRALSDLVSVMFHRSMEAAWPSMLELGRRLMAGGNMKAGQWTFSSAETGNPWHVAFTATKSGMDGGILYLCELDKERSEAAEDRKKALFDEASKLGNEEDARAAFAKILIGELKEDEEATEATEDYKNPADVMHVDEVKVFVFHGADGKPDFYDGYTRSLPELLMKLKKGKYASGGIGEMHPHPDHISSMEPSEAGHNHVSQFAGLFVPMDALYDGLDAAGLMRDVQERGKVVSGWEYRHYGEKMDAHIREAAQGAVYLDSGFAGPLSREVAVEFWLDTAGIDITSRIDEIEELIRLLQDNGHTSLDSQYDCNDLADYGHVVMQPDGSGTLWLRNQHGKYGVRFASGPDKDGIGYLTLARVGDEFGKSPVTIEEGNAGFLGAFEKAQWGPVNSGDERWYKVAKMGRFHDRTIRDFNNVLLTVETMWCCLKEDLGNHPRR